MVHSVEKADGSNGNLIHRRYSKSKMQLPSRKKAVSLQGLNIGGFSDSVFNVISAFLADNNQRFVAEVEAIEL